MTSLNLLLYKHEHCQLFTILYTVRPKKNYTLLKWLPNKKYMILGGKVYMYGKLIDSTFIWHQKVRKWFMLGWALLTFVKGMEIRVRRNGPSNFERGKSFGAYGIKDDMNNVWSVVMSLGLLSEIWGLGINMLCMSEHKLHLLLKHCNFPW